MVTLASTSPEFGIQPGDYRRREGHGESDPGARLSTGRHHHQPGGGSVRHLCLNLVAVPTGGGGGGSVKVTVPEDVPKFERSRRWRPPESGSSREMTGPAGESVTVKGDPSARLPTGRRHHYRARGGSVRHLGPESRLVVPTGLSMRSRSVEGNGSRRCVPKLEPSILTLASTSPEFGIQPGDDRRREGHGEGDSSARLPTGRPHYHRPGGGSLTAHLSESRRRPNWWWRRWFR